MSRVFRDLNSRLKRAGDKIDGALSFEVPGAFVDYQAAAKRLKVVQRDGAVDVSGSVGVNTLQNAEINADGTGYTHIVDGTASRILCDGSGVTILVSPTALAGAAAAFATVAAFDINGVMVSGAVPHDRATRSSVSTKNAAAVTVTAAGVTIVTLDIGSVVLGDFIEVSSRVQIGKGTTAGDTLILVGKASGTGDVVIFSDYTVLSDIFYHAASATQAITQYGVFRVSVAGTLVLRLYGSSSGSDSTVGASLGQIHARIVRNS